MMSRPDRGNANAELKHAPHVQHPTHFCQHPGGGGAVAAAVVACNPSYCDCETDWYSMTCAVKDRGSGITLIQPLTSMI
jgi:hypothetical protein